MRRLTVQVLGSFAITIDGQQVPTFGYAKVRALLAYLAVESQRRHSRAALATLLWPDQSEAAARASLSQALTTLRNALGDRDTSAPLLLADAHHVQLDPAGVVEVDVTRFLALLRAASAHAHHSWRTCAACAERVEQAIALYGGSFLADLSIADSDVFEEWASQQREHAQQRVLVGLERLRERAEWCGAVGEALSYARRLVTLEPLLDAYQHSYIRLLALNGEHTAALSHYRQFQTMLHQELAAEPEDATTDLVDQIRRGDMAGVQPVVPPFAVPIPPTPIVSRADEVRAVCGLVRDMKVRAVTITGTGGIGKTRLALEAAQALRYDFEDGVYVVELAALNDATLAADAIARTLGVKERPGSSISAAVREFIRGKQLLLILDNFEHVVTAAPLVADLLAACPALTVLVTSRAPLAIRGEHQYTLEPLAEADAVRLFVERAQAAGAGMADDSASIAVYSAICRRVDRLPLAIELIAVRARTLAPRELLRQLERPLQTLVHGPRDVPERHRALRNAIAWSYGLLSAEEQRVFMCLGVFAGGWSAEAAQAVLGDSIAVLPVLERLRHASLVTPTVPDATRFGMLETIREFALEQLESAGATRSGQAADETATVARPLSQPVAGLQSVLPARQTTARRHAAYFLDLLEQAVPELSGSGRARWTERLRLELPNLRVALQTLIEAQDGPSVLRGVAVLWHYWSDQGYLTEGRDWIDRALTLASTDDAALSPAHHETLLGAAYMAFVQDDYACARRHYEHLLALARRSDQQMYTARALDGLGTLVQCIGNLSEARELLEHSITASRAAGDSHGEHWTMCNLAFVHVQQGEYGTARSLVERAVAFYHGGANDLVMGVVQAYYAYVIAQQGDYSDARPLAEAALEIGIRDDLPWIQQIALNTLGLLAVQHDEYADARELFERALVQSQRLGDRLYTAAALSYLGLIDLREHEWERSATRLAEALELGLAIRSPKAITLAVEGYAYLWAARGEYQRATQLFGAIEMAYLRRDARPSPLTYELQRAYVQAAHEHLGPADFALAWAGGQALSLQAACAVASAPPTNYADRAEGNTLCRGQGIASTVLPVA